MTRLSIQYLNDSDGTVRAVQLPLLQWNKLVTTIRKYEQALQIKSDISLALAEVEQMRSGKIKKQTMKAFLNEL